MHPKKRERGGGLGVRNAHQDAARGPPRTLFPHGNDPFLVRETGGAAANFFLRGLNRLNSNGRCPLIFWGKGEKEWYKRISSVHGGGWVQGVSTVVETVAVVIDDTRRYTDRSENGMRSRMNGDFGCV